MKKSEAKSEKSAKNNFNPSEIEPKWQSKWEKDGIYHSDLDSAKRPFYNLMMFPYPSAEGMHAGNFFTFTGVDIYGRYKRMQGFDVFEPIGLDGFGIHSENYALKVGSHPVEQARKSEENFYQQFHSTGNAYDWERTVETYKPDYYKWTQWLFAELFKAGLAYRKKSPVNFCPSCKTVLADEQVIDGKCERCSSIVEKKNLEQWFFKITDYADRLLNNIDGLNWTEKVKSAQRNWIGKKEGIEISYKIEGMKGEIAVFTTRPDTNFGATFIAIAPEHPFVGEILKIDPGQARTSVQDDKKMEIESYIEAVKNKTEIDRQSEGREKTGVFTGFYAINPLTDYKMPVWISDFVLMGFGTGAVVGVPGHDKRDFEFATKFDLEIIRVVVGKDGDKSEITEIDQVQEEKGTMINSGFLNGLDIHEATEKIMDYIEKKGYGKRQVTYHLRDWLISRQRYWGPPIPMIFCEACQAQGKSWFTSDEGKEQKELRIKNKELSSSAEAIQNTKYIIHNTEVAGWYPVPEKDLSVELPYIEDFKPLGTGGSPLANHPEFYEVKCPECGKNARRETDVSDTFLDSSWYFFRYISTEFKDKPFDKDRAKKWLPVHMYIGGAEHSVLHLLYARFITMFLKDKGLISFEEPFARFYAHGLIIKDGAKMSKSKGNIINPDQYIKKYGADTLRAYLHFLGPFDQTGDFRDSGVEGMNRFLKRVWTMFTGQNIVSKQVGESARANMHEAIKQVTEDMEGLRFNTAIAHMMSYYNKLSKQDKISYEEMEVYLKLLAPFTPHLTEELYQSLRDSQNNAESNSAAAEHERKTTQKESGAPRGVSRGSAFNSIHTSPWPTYDEKYLISETIKIPVQVNGKLRSMLEISVSDIDDKDKIEDLARNDEKVLGFLKGTVAKKFIYIPGKVANFVVDTANS